MKSSEKITNLLSALEEIDDTPGDKNYAVWAWSVDDYQVDSEGAGSQYGAAVGEICT